MVHAAAWQHEAAAAIQRQMRGYRATTAEGHPTTGWRSSPEAEVRNARLVQDNRDLKAANVLLTLDGRGKISDFGLGKADDLKTSTTASTMRDGGLAGTPAFMAPELLDENTFTEKSDVYSYAVVLWEIYDRGIPWAGLKPMQIMRQVVDKHARPDIPKTMPNDRRELMRRAWADEPDARPTFATIKAELLGGGPEPPAKGFERPHLGFCLS